MSKKQIHNYCLKIYSRKSAVNFLLLVAMVLSFSACRYFKRKTTEKPLARVGEAYLYPSDLKGLFAKGTSHEDSTVIITTYINKWIHSKLLLSKAQLNLKDEQKDFQKRIEDYKNSLLIYTYEKNLVNQKLDTVVLDSQIVNYYDANKKNFELKKHIVKAVFLKINKSVSGQNKLQRWLKKPDAENFAKLNKYATQYVQIFQTDTSKWVLLSDLNNALPKNEQYTYDRFQNGQYYFECSDSLNNYYVRVFDFKLKNSTSPLSFETQNIKSIILNRRKLMLIKKMKKDIYNNALKKKQFDVYYQVKDTSQ